MRDDAVLQTIAPASRKRALAQDQEFIASAEKADDESRRHRRRHHRRHHGLGTGRGRPRGHRVRAPRLRRRGIQLRQRGRGRARLRHPLGRARHARARCCAPCSRRTRRSSCAGRCRATTSRWMWRWQRACKLDTYLANRARMQRLAFYSRDRLHEITEALRARVRAQRRLHGAAALQAATASWCSPACRCCAPRASTFKEIDADEARKHRAGAQHRDRACRRHPPARRRGRQLPAVRAAAQERGRRPGRAVPLQLRHRAAASRPRRHRARLDAGRAAPSAPALRRGGRVRRRRLGRAAAPLGLRIPLAPVYGYSISAHIREPLNAPRSAVMDERYKVAISRLGQRVRVAGSAEIGGSPDAINRGRAADALQGAARLVSRRAPRLQAGVQQWKGARPMLPDGPPVIGASGIPGVWLNLGHGSSGWALVLRQRTGAGRPDGGPRPRRGHRRPGHRAPAVLH